MASIAAASGGAAEDTADAGSAKNCAGVAVDNETTTSSKPSPSTTPGSTPAMSDSTSWPTTADSYALGVKIGEGAFAKVYRATCFHAGAEHSVAIKVMDLEKVTSGIDDIRSEVTTMKQCVHPNVLTCHACFTVDENLWLVMPYMDHGSCLHILRRMKRLGHQEGLPQEWVRYVMSEALKGIQYLHDQGLIHRDIKAGNILVDSEGSVKIADFGVSGWLQEDGAKKQNRNTFVGTPCWMAPEVMEQVDGYSYPADVWSIGITAMELTKGYAPYALELPMKVLLLVLRQDPPTLATYKDEQKGATPSPGTEWASKSGAFKDFLSKCMKKQPKDRAKVKELLVSKFLRNKKIPSKQKFSLDLNQKIAKRLHQVCLDDEQNPSKADTVNPQQTATAHKQTRSFVENENTDWDFGAILGTSDVKDEKAGADKGVDEANNDDFGEAFMKSTTMRETS